MILNRLFILTAVSLSLAGCCTNPPLQVPAIPQKMILQPCERPSHLNDRTMGALLQHDIETMKRLHDCADKVDAYNSTK